MKPIYSRDILPIGNAGRYGTLVGFLTIVLEGHAFTYLAGLQNHGIPSRLQTISFRRIRELPRHVTTRRFTRPLGLGPTTPTSVGTIPAQDTYNLVYELQRRGLTPLILAAGHVTNQIDPRNT